MQTATMTTTTSRRHLVTEVKPRNGRHYVALLAGGPHDIFLEIRDKLADCRGIWIQHHWEYQRAHSFDSSIPKDVDLVIILKDMISHADQDKAVRACKRAEIPFIRTQRKWSAMEPSLRMNGFLYHAPLDRKLPPAPQPLSLALVTPPPTTAPEPQAITRTAPQSAPAAVPLAAAASSGPRTDAAPLPATLSIVKAQQLQKLYAAVVQAREAMEALGAETLMIVGDEVSIEYRR